MPENILVIDDEKALVESVAYSLRQQGYSVSTAATGTDGLEQAKKVKPDLIILDIMLPGMDGFEVCRQVRQELNTPILMLTARDDEIDRVVGLEVGADDYLTKPFSMRELMARVKALLRRIKLIQEDSNRKTLVVPAQSVLKFENLEINNSSREVLLNGSPLELKPKEYELLLFFAKHLRQVLSRDHILQDVWGWDFTGESRTVDVHVRWLREKIEADPSQPKRIITVRSAGYRFEG